jgi:hypothetical protein
LLLLKYSRRRLRLIPQRDARNPGCASAVRAGLDAPEDGPPIRQNA